MPPIGNQTGDEVFALLGASRGLGRAVHQRLLAVGVRPSQIHVISRKSEISLDFADSERWPALIQTLHSLKATHVWYFAGGGPFGDYAQKNWRDHEWAFRVNFMAPAYVLHALTKETRQVGQLICVGSAVAGTRPDPRAASYAAGKHALRGLMTSVQAENATGLDLRLFEPTYLDTPMLPPNAKPRQTPGMVRPLAEVSQEFVSWALNSNPISQNLSHPVFQSTEASIYSAARPIS
jgi:short-subunit dehydrogenase